jgi:hypothetical protein
MKLRKTKVIRTKRRIKSKRRDEIRTTITKQTNSDLPPNENIQKFADEVYGDTKIPYRRHPKP